MFPAEHRALRELHATSRQLRNHWAKLATRLDEPVLNEGSDKAAQLLRELEPRMAGRPSAQTLGARLAGLRDVSDLLLERNQALRTALLDLHHVVTLLDYLAALARTRDDAELAEWEADWVLRLTDLETRARAAAVTLGTDPDGAIAPADGSSLGRAGAKLGALLGTLGEAIDNSPVGRLSGRRAT